MATITTWTLCSCRHRTNPCISEQRHVDVYFGRLREKHRPDECPSSPTRKKLKLEHHSPAHQEQPGVLRPTRFSSELLVEAVCGRIVITCRLDPLGPLFTLLLLTVPLQPRLTSSDSLDCPRAWSVPVSSVLFADALSSPPYEAPEVRNSPASPDTDGLCLLSDRSSIFSAPCNELRTPAIVVTGGALLELWLGANIIGMSHYRRHRLHRIQEHRSQ